eukprot:CAMPEP_0168531048 /NCGR_PEP_ID=MMETSP0405-20121227/15134_1 /TAXON_ID=498012 /ORGANISM="Trichosphaerium sp, Strain Am-I-7 wt" /LENGTH=1322 /DNA_ID=CAMNT_0008555613 /DNA_START=110 /DNA_END=4078 /DNA_ORIENTATION=+
MSHLRFGDSAIKSEYEIVRSNFVACHFAGYVGKFDILGTLEEGGIFVLNSPWDTMEKLERNLPASFKRELAAKKLHFYNVDAGKVAKEVGLGKRINMVMQTAFFKLSKVLPFEQAFEILLDNIEKTFGRKGPKVVKMNQDAVHKTLAVLQEIKVPESWLTAKDETDLVTHSEHHPAATLQKDLPTRDAFVEGVMKPCLSLKGTELPVSSFLPGGQAPTGTTKYEKRAIATEVPVWIPENCTQCNYCAIVCPHAAIRPFLLTKEETKAGPEKYEAIKTQGDKDIAGYHYSINVAPYGCTGCEVCVASCPDDALVMKPLPERMKEYEENWDYLTNIPVRGDLTDKNTVKGSQFQQPLMEFSGACAGCGETPYVKLATQLFGDRMIIANASGCSSVWGGTYGEHPYTVNDQGRGPAWGRSLFEDNAEYGYGMFLATKQRRQQLFNDLEQTIGDDSLTLSAESRKALQTLHDSFNDTEICRDVYKAFTHLIEKEKATLPKLETLWKQRDMIIPPSHWIIGGDGWAYDIGFGGLDHVLADPNNNVNVLVLDTEMYSNTGGQSSKATPRGAVVKYALAGKSAHKKDLGQLAMMYKHVYVASVSLAANMNQCVQAFKEAEEYDGPSLIIAYSPCVDWGHEEGTPAMIAQEKEAVESGYWTLYRYNPTAFEKGANPFILDSIKIRRDLEEFLGQETRFQSLARAEPKRAASLHESLDDFNKVRLEQLHAKSMDELDMLDALKKKLGEQTGEKIHILYGSETGNAADVSKNLVYEFKRREVRAVATAMDDFDLDELPTAGSIICVIATCGQGEFPGNSKGFWKALSNPELPADYLADLKYTVFGLGDSSYVFYNETAKLVDARLQELGATKFHPTGLGDDQHDDRYDTELEEWQPDLFNELNTPDPPQVLPEATHKVERFNIQVAKENNLSPTVDRYVPPGADLVPLSKVDLLTPVNYDRDIRHIEFDLSGKNMHYELGDSLGIWPMNPKEWLEPVYDYLGVAPTDIVTLQDMQNSRKFPFPAAITAETLLSQVLDIFGRPKRRFYEMLSLVATSEEEKATLRHLITKEGKEEMQVLVKDTANHLEIMKMFPSAKPNLATLVDFIPEIKPRLYSIASSTEYHGKDALHLLVVADEWKTSKGVEKHGLCTKYLRDMTVDEGPLVASRVNAAAVQYPEDQCIPLILAGLGTGLAPFRAVIEERAIAMKKGEKVGPIALFFGARHKKTEFSYQDELEKFQEMGVLTSIHCAWSRDQKQKVYVQNKLSEVPELVVDYLINKKGNFYFCGPGGSVPGALEKEVANAFIKKAGMSEKDAEETITKMKLAGKYCVEAW